MLKSTALATTALLLLLGSTGSSFADVRDVVHDESSGTIVRSTSGACVRTQWSNGYDMCSTEVAVAPKPVAHVQQTAAISREDRTIYFGFNKSTLSPEMKQRLDTLATNLRSNDQVKGAHIVGYADRIGNAGYNEKLSKKRADSVRHYLVARGVINTDIADTRWFGESNPATSCPDGLKRPQLIECLQPDRRVEVEIDFAPDVQATR